MGDKDLRSEFNMAALSLERLTKLQSDANKASVEARLDINRDVKGFKKTFEYLMIIKRLNVEIAAIAGAVFYKKTRDKINALLKNASIANGDTLLAVLDEIDDLNAELLATMQKHKLLYPVYTALSVGERFDEHLGN